MTAWLFRDFPYQTSLEASVVTADARGLVLDCTIYYPHGGGQPGDTGTLLREDGTRLPIIDTLKGETRGEIVHVLPAGLAGPRAGESVRLELDWERRYAHMRMHTACHLLSAVLPYPVTGGSIRRDSARLDFDMPAHAADREELAERVNALIDAGHPVSTEWIEDAEFDKREELVRTLAVAPPRGTGRVRLVRIEGRRPAGLRRHARRQHARDRARRRPEDREQGPAEPPRDHRVRGERGARTAASGRGELERVDRRQPQDRGQLVERAPRLVEQRRIGKVRRGHAVAVVAADPRFEVRGERVVEKDARADRGTFGFASTGRAAAGTRDRRRCACSGAGRRP